MSKLGRLAFAAVLAFLTAMPMVAHAGADYAKYVGRDKANGQFKKLTPAQRRLRDGVVGRDAKTGRFMSLKPQAQPTVGRDAKTGRFVSLKQQTTIEAAAPAKQSLGFKLGRLYGRYFTAEGRAFGKAEREAKRQAANEHYLDN
jgi:hypothetical protein